ncbi:hypothetical protein R1flu_022099 [Riccia fluitans]|uniref:Uncharacterized protein n=1 Tax=Riccia fluitans TaxID=41844 RepID=A0ABD1ZR79_9MARC
MENSQVNIDEGSAAPDNHTVKWPRSALLQLKVATNAPRQKFTKEFLGLAALAIAHSMPWPVKILLKVAASLFLEGVLALLSLPMRSSLSTRNIGIALVSTGLAVIVAVLVLSFCRHLRRS